VTLALAVWRDFPWKKVPIYMFAQLMGGLVGAAIIYGNYFHAIDIFEGGRGIRTQKTASLFATYAVRLYLISFERFQLIPVVHDSSRI
jgi:aquaglyceroporin related protein